MIKMYFVFYLLLNFEIKNIIKHCQIEFSNLLNYINDKIYKIIWKPNILKEKIESNLES